MRTKVLAAQRAATSGCATIIASGREPLVLERLKQGETIGTLLIADQEPLVARKQWIASQLQMRGKVWLDEGAVNAILNTGKSLLPIGVTRIEGVFERGDVVGCFAPNGQIIAKGLVNYASEEVIKLNANLLKQLSSY